MCISIPGQIIEIVDPVHRLAHVELSGTLRLVNLGMLPPEEAAVGGWVLVEAGLALQSIPAEEAQGLLDFLKEFDRLFEEEI